VSELPYRVEKPWGHELIWARTDRYVGKILHIEPGHVLRLQEGDTLIERPVREGEAFHIHPKLIHQFEAVVATDLLEASTPELDDVVRVKDRYGRV